MKGVSTVIATLLMLVITIALAGMAYVYISGFFTTQTQGIEVVDAYCVGNSVTITIKNIGTRNITQNSITLRRISPTINTTNFPSTDLPPQNTITITDNCQGANPKTCIYRIIPPAGRPVEVSVPCY